MVLVTLRDDVGVVLVVAVVDNAVADDAVEADCESADDCYNLTKQDGATQAEQMNKKSESVQ